MFCSKCQCDRTVYPDVVSNQPIQRCLVCHRQLAAGTVLPSNQRTELFTNREKYRPVGLDGVSRPKRERAFRNAGLTLVEAIVLLAVVAIVAMVIDSVWQRGQSSAVVSTQR